MRIEWPDPEGQEIVERLFAVEAALRAHFEQVAADVGLTVPQAHTLIQLEEPQRMGKVAGPAVRALARDHDRRLPGTVRLPFGVSVPGCRQSKVTHPIWTGTRADQRPETTSYAWA